MPSAQKDAASHSHHATYSPSESRSGFADLPLYQPPPPLAPRTRQQTEEDPYRKMSRGRPRRPKDRDFAAGLMKLPERDENLLNMLKPIKPSRRKNASKSQASAPASGERSQPSTPSKRERSSEQCMRAATSSDEDMPVRRRPARRAVSTDEELPVQRTPTSPRGPLEHHTTLNEDELVGNELAQPA